MFNFSAVEGRCRGTCSIERRQNGRKNGSSEPATIRAREFPSLALAPKFSRLTRNNYPEAPTFVLSTVHQLNSLVFKTCIFFISTPFFLYAFPVVLHIHIAQWPHQPPQPARQKSMPSSKRQPPTLQRSSAVLLSTPDSPWLVPSAVQLPTEVSHPSMCKFAILSTVAPHRDTCPQFRLGARDSGID